MTVSQYQQLTQQEVEEVASELTGFEAYKPADDDEQGVFAFLVARSTVERFRVHNLIETIRTQHMEIDDLKFSKKHLLGLLKLERERANPN